MSRPFLNINKPKKCLICDRVYLRRCSQTRWKESKTCSHECGIRYLSIIKQGFQHSKESLKKMQDSHKKEDKSPNWKGDGVCYRALHIWVEKKLGKPHFCEHCKKSDLKHRQYHWANVSQQYKRVVGDWIRLCVKCHKKYDNTL